MFWLGTTGADAIGIQWVEARDIGKHNIQDSRLSMPTTPLQTKNYLAPNVSVVEIEKPCSNQRQGS